MEHAVPDAFCAKFGYKAGQVEQRTSALYEKGAEKNTSQKFDKPLHRLQVKRIAKQHPAAERKLFAEQHIKYGRDRHRNKKLNVIICVVVRCFCKNPMLSSILMKLFLLTSSLT